MNALCALSISAAVVQRRGRRATADRRHACCGCVQVDVKKPWPLWEQAYQPVDPFFLRNAYHAPPPEPIAAIYLGTLPATILAGIVSEALFPNGWLGWRLSSPFDLRWACLHFCFATAFWYAIGRCAETTRGNWRNLASEYIVARLIFVPAFLSFWLDSWGALCSMLLAVFWIVLALLLTFKGFLQTWQRFRSETVSAR